ncbi:MAG: hypothetical protein JO112_18845 [Planctomycetes bacterium]|nr:hypothetical protein [Planctomycetota bacterium]
MVSPSNSAEESGPLFCDRCGAELRPGTGNFYQIHIEAVADPTPPDIPEETSAADLGRQIQEVLAQMEDLSAQEAMDQVHRRLTLFLCLPCYRVWIENPTG